MSSDNWTIRDPRILPMMGEAFNATVDDGFDDIDIRNDHVDQMLNDDHKCAACDVLYPCESPTWDDCDCRIYCERCEEARQETPGP